MTEQHMPADAPELRIDPDEVFFSMTDLRGRVVAANSVFHRYSGYAADELLGRPHNIVRDHEMPAGVFRLMWATIRADAVFCGYVRNISRDGRPYWVVATVVRAGERYLSVRAAPQDGAALHVMSTLYHDVLEAERTSRAHGASRAESAATGAHLLELGAQRMGYSSYAELARELLPHEVGARGGVRTPIRGNGSACGAMRRIIGICLDADRGMRDLVSRLDRWHDLSDRLVEVASVAAATTEGLHQALRTAAEVSRSASADHPALARLVTAMSADVALVVESLRSVTSTAREVREHALDLRFRVALTALHVRTLHGYAVELARQPPRRRDITDVAAVGHALRDDLHLLERRQHDATVSATVLGTALPAVQAQLHDVRGAMSRWRLLLTRTNMAGTLNSAAAPVDSRLDATFDIADRLRNLTRDLTSLEIPLDVSALRDAVDSMIRSELLRDDDQPQAS